MFVSFSRFSPSASYFVVIGIQVRSLFIGARPTIRRLPICSTSVMRLVHFFILVPPPSLFPFFLLCSFCFFFPFSSLSFRFVRTAPIRASPRLSPPRRVVRLPFKFISPFTIPSLFLFRPLLDPCHLFDGVGCSSRPSLESSLVDSIVRT